MTLPDDMTCPSTDHVISKTNIGNEGAMLARPSESLFVKPEDSSRDGAHAQQKHPLQDAETAEHQQNGISEENIGLDSKESERDKSEATTSEEETNAHVCRQRRGVIANRIATMDRHSEKSLSFLKFTPLPPGLARVPPAHVGERSRPPQMQRSTRHSWPSST